MHLSQVFSNIRRGSRAQAMVEFALALPIFLLVVYGLLEVGRLIFMEAAVITSSREAVRYASAWGVNSAGVQQYDDCAGIRNAAKNTAFLLGLQDSSINICYDSGPGTNTDANCKDAYGNLVQGKNIKAYCSGPSDTASLTSGQRVVVTVSATYNPVLPLFLPLTQKNMASTAFRTVLGVVDLNTPTP
jgi:Flp pilus assembly protein TadG